MVIRFYLVRYRTCASSKRGGGIGRHTVHGETLADIPTTVAADEELEVVVFVLDHSYLVIFIDEVSALYLI